MTTPGRDHVIRIEREGTAPRWVKHIGRGERAAECTVTYHQAEARRMAADTAHKHAERLAATLGSHRCELHVQRLEG